MKAYSWREREENGDSDSDSVKGKVPKSRLYFLGDPKKLQKNDLDRHVCKGCNRVFHKSQGLEWHVMDKHPHLVEEVKRDLELISANKRTERGAANMDEKRRKFGDDITNNYVEHDEENCKYSDSDIKQLLESSDDEENVSDKKDTQGCKDRLQKQQVIKKKCEVKIKKVILKEKKCDVKLQKLILKEKKCDVKLQKVNLTGANDYLENVESHENNTSKDEESILIETASDSSVLEHAPCSQLLPSPQERECYGKLQKLCLAEANDDCENVVNDENYIGDDESIVVETATDSSVIELSPSSNQLAVQPDTSAAQDINSVAASIEPSSLAPVMVANDKVQWWFKKFD